MSVPERAQAQPGTPWERTLAAPPEPGEGCACQWCRDTGRAPPEPVPDLPDGHRETD